MRQVAIATDAAKLREAQAKLALLQREQDRLRQRQREQQEKIDREIRNRPVKVDPSCLNNSLCKKP